MLLSFHRTQQSSDIYQLFWSGSKSQISTSLEAWDNDCGAMDSHHLHKMAHVSCLSLSLLPSLALSLILSIAQTHPVPSQSLIYTFTHTLSLWHLPKHTHTLSHYGTYLSTHSHYCTWLRAHTYTHTHAQENQHTHALCTQVFLSNAPFRLYC